MEADVFMLLMDILGQVNKANPIPYEVNDHRLSYAIGLLTNGGTIGSNRDALLLGDGLFSKFLQVNILILGSLIGFVITICI